MTLEYEYQGPKPGADRAVLLAHGAGADMHAAALIVTADALADAKIPSLRFQYPYRSAGKKAPDRPAVLAAATREAAAELARRTKLPPDRLVLGGRSMGGRYCSLVAAGADDTRHRPPGTAGSPRSAEGDLGRLPCLGVLLLGYPLHPAGKPDQLRVEHFGRLTMPVLFVSGTRDSLAGRPGLTKAARAVAGPVTFHWLDSADHGFRPLKASGRTINEVLVEAATFSVDWVCALPG